MRGWMMQSISIVGDHLIDRMLQQKVVQPFFFGLDLPPQGGDLLEDGPAKAGPTPRVFYGMCGDLGVGQLGEFGAEQVSGGAAAGQKDLVPVLEEAPDQRDAASGMAQSPVEGCNQNLPGNVIFNVRHTKQCSK